MSVLEKSSLIAVEWKLHGWRFFIVHNNDAFNKEPPSIQDLPNAYAWRVNISPQPLIVETVFMVFVNDAFFEALEELQCGILMHEVGHVFDRGLSREDDEIMADQIACKYGYGQVILSELKERHKASPSKIFEARIKRLVESLAL